MSSPTQRTLAALRKLGYLAAVVEKWNHGAHIRQDLFGFIDVLAIGGGDCMACTGTGQIGGTPRRGPVRECNLCAGAGRQAVETLAVQATTGDHVAHRIEKIVGDAELHQRAAMVKAAGWRVEVWGWRKNSKGRWVLRREAL